RAVKERDARLEVLVERVDGLRAGEQEQAEDHVRHRAPLSPILRTVILLLASRGQPAMVSTLAPDVVTAALDAHLAKVARRRARRGLPAPQVLVRAPGFEYSSGDRALPFHAASVAKLATAAPVMQEVEAGAYGIARRVAGPVPAAETAGLVAAPGATVEQRLGHTSGGADYCGGRVTRGRTMQYRVVTERDREWTHESLLAFSRERQRP